MAMNLIEAVRREAATNQRLGARLAMGRGSPARGAAPAHAHTPPTHNKQQPNTWRLGANLLVCDTGFPANAPAIFAGRPPASVTMFQASIWNTSSAAYGRLGWANFTCPGLAQAQAAGRLGCGSAAQEAECVSMLTASVEEGDAWVGFYAPSNFSANLLTQMRSYAGERKSMLFTYIWDQGRGYTTYSWVGRIVRAIVDGVSSSFGQMVAASPGAANIFAPSFFLRPVECVFFYDDDVLFCLLAVFVSFVVCLFSTP